MEKIRKIRKNYRFPFSLSELFFPLIIKKNKSFRIVKLFKFTDSCIYNFNNNDQHDVNKLFGFSIGWHHTNSYRFGWRPSKDLTKMEIVTYEYKNKIRIPTTHISDIELNRWYRYELKYNAILNTIEYTINTISDKNNNHSFRSTIINLKYKINWGYTLNLYFGGNKKAPHDMHIFEFIN